MALFVLVPGAGGQAAYWALLVPELERRGHRATAVDIAEDNPALGLPDYAEIPEPGETPGQWFENTGAGEARFAADAAAGRSGEFDASTHFLHDLSPRALAVLTAAGPPREPADTVFGPPGRARQPSRPRRPPCRLRRRTQEWRLLPPLASMCGSRALDDRHCRRA